MQALDWTVAFAFITSRCVPEVWSSPPAGGWEPGDSREAISEDVKRTDE
jgi:hypothetical protein